MIEGAKARGKPAPPLPIAAQALICVFALTVLAGLMYSTWVDVYPDGKSWTLADFCIFWFREIVLGFIAAAGVLFYAVAKCGDRVKRLLPGLNKPL